MGEWGGLGGKAMGVGSVRGVNLEAAQEKIDWRVEG